MRSEPLLQLRALTQMVSDKRLVDGLSLSVQPGEFHGLLGPNGAGKTTALRCLYQKKMPTSGEILLSGRPMADYSRTEWARRTGALIQENAPLHGLNATDVVEIALLGLRLTPAQRRRRVHEALDLAGLTEATGQQASELSGGEQQRLHLACLLARDPEIYLLDEPTNHLDLHYQLRLLDAIRDRGRTVLATLHDLALASRYCDQVTLIDHGKQVDQGPPLDVLSTDNLRHTYRVQGSVSKQGLHLVAAV